MGFILAALVLGLAGSLHCVGMCGPLMLAMPHPQKTGIKWILNKMINQGGRILTYSILGVIVGTVGQSIATAGFQQYLSIAAGILMLLFIAWPAGMKRFNTGPLSFMSWLKGKFALLIQKKNAQSLFLLGVLNGLLPCGLVYVALSASLALGSVWKGALFMALFGIGTSPALLAVSGFGSWIKEKIHFRTFKYVQMALAVVALLVVLRGANLGIPYVSPKVKVENKEVKMDCCHKPGH